jgi:hypothetical protein
MPEPKEQVEEEGGGPMPVEEGGVEGDDRVGGGGRKEQDKDKDKDKPGKPQPQVGGGGR